MKQNPTTQQKVSKMKKLAPISTPAGVNTFAIAPSDTKHIVFLTANTEYSLDLTNETKIVSITSTGDFFMGDGSSPIEVPTATTTNYSLQFNPAVRKVDSGMTVRFVAAEDVMLEVSEYA